jgi:hypothetical protein
LLNPEELPMSEEPAEIEKDEVDEVLAVLEELMQKVTSPVVRACLEEARNDVRHLTGRDAWPAEGREEAAA